MLKKFEVGKTYRFHGGYRYTVTDRTAGTVTVNNGHGSLTLRIHRGYSTICAVEVVMPFGEGSGGYFLRADAEMSE